MTVLQQLVINDLAVIDELDLEFKPGMTVLTGETGAGKSILLDAIGLILGDRADSSVIRGGCDKTDVTAVFSLTDLPDVVTQLSAMDIDGNDNELFVRRVVNRDGRSRAYLNNNPVPIQSLRDIGQSLVDIYGQHAHQSLSRPTAQRELLDQFGDYTDLLNAVADNFQQWKNVSKQLQGFQTEGEDYHARLALLRYQIEELTELDIAENEYEELTMAHKRLSNSQRLLDACQAALEELAISESSIDDRVAQHQSRIAELATIDNDLNNTSELLENAHIQIEEAITELREYIERIDNDASDLERVEKRLDAFHDLARKHRVNPDMLAEHLVSLQEELNKLEHGQEHHATLTAQLEALQQAYFEQADALSEGRQIAAKQISEAITEKMHELGISGRFQIDVERIQDNELHQFGNDKINFMVSTNPGQPLRPITKVASGGELSRLSLAIQIIGSKDSGVPTLIFDEVDTGISGGIAEVVGRLLHSLSVHRQIFCITHLAQVASCGNNHLRVAKTTDDGQTFTRVETLNKEQRVDEIARMLAGVTITNESRANAEKMLEAV